MIGAGLMVFSIRLSTLGALLLWLRRGRQRKNTVTAQDCRVE